MRRDAVPIKSHVQAEEKVEKSDLKASDKILQKTPVAQARTKHINIRYSHFIREELQIDGMQARIQDFEMGG